MLVRSYVSFDVRCFALVIIVCGSFCSLLVLGVVWCWLLQCVMFRALFVVCCLLSVACSLLVVCCLLGYVVVCCVLGVGCCLMRDVCNLRVVFVVRCLCLLTVFLWL